MVHGPYNVKLLAEMLLVMMRTKCMQYSASLRINIVRIFSYVQYRTELAEIKKKRLSL